MPRYAARTGVERRCDRRDRAPATENARAAVAFAGAPQGVRALEGGGSDPRGGARGVGARREDAAAPLARQASFERRLGHGRIAESAPAYGFRTARRRLEGD